MVRYSVYHEVIKELVQFIRESESSLVRELSAQLWSVNQRTTEAEAVTDS
jgi:hypothetical protein